MNEKLLHYIWQFQLFSKSELITVENNKLEILNPGNHNQNQGPDFLNGKIKIDDTIWAGHIEMHVNSSDWILHGHSHDDNYKNVMLHVVWNHDKDLQLSFPTLSLKTLVPKILIKKYISLMENTSFIPCEKNISEVRPLIINKWKERLIMERLQEKTKWIVSLLDTSKGNWDEVCWWILARNFGGTVNAAAFEAIARSIPLQLIQKHADSLFTIESIIIGQSGLLNRKFKDSYPNDLFRDYLFYKRKYSLRQPPVPLHFLRMRPANFPTIKLAQLCVFIYNEKKWLRKIIDETDLENLKTMFHYNISEYWNTHYRFDEPGNFKEKKVGTQTINNFLINAAVTICYAYGYYHGLEKIKEKAIQWLEKLTAENNHITIGFEKLGITNNSAFDSQALLHLKNKFCLNKLCLDCAIGNDIIRNREPVEVTSSYR